MYNIHNSYKFWKIVSCNFIKHIPLKCTAHTTIVNKSLDIVERKLAVAQKVPRQQGHEPEDGFHDFGPNFEDDSDEEEAEVAFLSVQLSNLQDMRHNLLEQNAQAFELYNNDGMEREAWDRHHDKLIDELEESKF